MVRYIKESIGSIVDQTWKHIAEDQKKQIVQTYIEQWGRNT